MVTFSGMIQYLRNIRDENGESIYENNDLNDLSQILSLEGLDEINPLINFVLGPDLENPIENNNNHWEEIGINGNIGLIIYNYFLDNIHS